MSKVALIGHSGFVGSNLRAQGSFDSLFNSKNFLQLRGGRFSEVWCCGVSAVKWLANKEPEQDYVKIKALLEILETVHADKAVLISTIDVFAEPKDVDESNDPHTESGLHPYGRHRLLVEDFFLSHFDTVILRLPGLFGPGLKKNIIYDFLHNNNIDQINSHSVFQFYNLANIHSDISKVIQAGLRLAHLATAPVSVAEVAREALALDFNNGDPDLAVQYNMCTCHAGLWGKRGRHINTQEESLTEIKAFVERERQGRPYVRL